MLLSFVPFTILSTAALVHSAPILRLDTRVSEAHHRHTRTSRSADVPAQYYSDELVARQLPDLSGLTSIMTNVESSLAGLGQITSQGNVDIINNLLKSTNTILSDTAVSIPAILTGVQGIASPANVQSIGTLLGNVNGLLNQNFVTQIQGLVGGAAKLLDEGGDLLTPDTIKSLQGVLSGASSLLSPQNVDHLTDVINDITPLVDSVTKVLSVLIGAIMAPPAPN